MKLRKPTAPTKTSPRAGSTPIKASAPQKEKWQLGVPALSLPPCAYPHPSCGNGLFRLAEGRIGDLSGSVSDRLTRIIDYRRWAMEHRLVHMVLTLGQLEALLSSWGADPARAKDAIDESEFEVSVDGEDDLPVGMP